MVQRFAHATPIKLSSLDHDVLPQPYDSLAYPYCTRARAVMGHHNTDAPLPAQPTRLPYRVSQPIPSTSCPAKDSARFFGSMSASSHQSLANDPLYRIACESAEVSLFLSSKPLDQVVQECSAAAQLPPRMTSLASGGDAMECTPQKRGLGEVDMAQDSGRKRRKGPLAVYGEAMTPDHARRSVMPEDILRMVDSSLVETPERDITIPRVLAAAPGPSPRVPGARYAYTDSGADNLQPPVLRVNRWFANSWGVPLRAPLQYQPLGPAP